VQLNLSRLHLIGFIKADVRVAAPSEPAKNELPSSFHGESAREDPVVVSIN
jgi:hypothetical protein